MLTDPDFLRQRSAALGERDVEIQAAKRGSELIITMDRTVKRDLPSFLAKLFSSEQTFELVETWRETSDGREASYELRFEGQPVTVYADITLSDSEDGCIYEIEHTCKARFPLIGGRVEKYVLDQVIEGCDEELEYLVEQL